MYVAIYIYTVWYSACIMHRHAKSFAAVHVLVLAIWQCCCCGWDGDVCFMFHPLLHQRQCRLPLTILLKGTAGGIVGNPWSQVGRIESFTGYVPSLATEHNLYAATLMPATESWKSCVFLKSYVGGPSTCICILDQCWSNEACVYVRVYMIDMYI